MKKEKKYMKFQSVEDFGKEIGLSQQDIAIIKAKQALIEKIKTVRLKRKLSQKQLADILGTKQPAIARMEAGIVSEVSFDFLVKLSIALDIPIHLQPKKIKQAA